MRHSAMQRFYPTIFFCMVPFFISLGHDVYLFQQNPEYGFQLSAAGYVWTQYNPESYRSFLSQMDPETIAMVNGFLKMKMSMLMFVLGLILPGLMALEYFFLKLLFGRMGGNYKP